MADSNDFEMPLGRPPDGDPPEHDFLDDIDQAVERITDERIEDRLRETFGRVGYATCPPPVAPDVAAMVTTPGPDFLAGQALKSELESAWVEYLSLLAKVRAARDEADKVMTMARDEADSARDEADRALSMAAEMVRSARVKADAIIGRAEAEADAIIGRAEAATHAIAGRAWILAAFLIGDARRATRMSRAGDHPAQAGAEAHSAVAVRGQGGTVVPASGTRLFERLLQAVAGAWGEARPDEAQVARAFWQASSGETGVRWKITGSVAVCEFGSLTIVMPTEGIYRHLAAREPEADAPLADLARSALTGHPLGTVIISDGMLCTPALGTGEHPWPGGATQEDPPGQREEYGHPLVLHHHGSAGYAIQQDYLQDVLNDALLGHPHEYAGYAAGDEAAQAVGYLHGELDPMEPPTAMAELRIMLAASQRARRAPHPPAR
jgi:hypothetical protein